MIITVLQKDRFSLHLFTGKVRVVQWLVLTSERMSAKLPHQGLFREHAILVCRPPLHLSSALRRELVSAAELALLSFPPL